MNNLEKYIDTRSRLKALTFAGFIINWDGTISAPTNSTEEHSTQIGVLTEMEYELSTNAEYLSAVEQLYEARGELAPALSHEIEVEKRSIDKLKKIPLKEYVEYQKLLNDIYPVYVECKGESNFNKFVPYLTKVIDFKKNYMKYLETPDKQGYDVLLDDYENDYTQVEYDKFFNLLKAKLVPFVKKIAQTKLEGDFSFGNLFYPTDKQKEFCEYIRDVMCFDKTRGIMAESEHPFTSGFGIDDVRITVHYYENNFISAIFSTIHETGHALYQQQIDPKLRDTFCVDGASMGMHESQSRLYENYIGRSYAFWAKHYSKLQDTFPEQLGNVTLDTFYKYINRPEMSFIRTEADELTYPLHIMLRYDIEKEICNGSLALNKLPERWNQLFFEYFGLKVPSDKDGVMQDVHWALGDLGYFPTYALGTAYSAQFINAMSKEFDVYESLSAGNTKAINEWLREHIHRFGSSKYPKEILRNATGEDFNPQYYVDYLINKYSLIYGVI